ncbi:uncharacterized protein METZ01_LOCUS175376 [marine metagenome]|uniref:Uncharacterized protein n=1 Tax=marine metagenome TaxID=408172 RepID=A0A382C9N4_9ZZZZ
MANSDHTASSWLGDFKRMTILLDRCGSTNGLLDSQPFGMLEGKSLRVERWSVSVPSSTLALREPNAD